MTRYIFRLVLFVPVYLLGMLIAPALPLFATMQEGPANNGGETAIEPRLPWWLYWFDTTYDNGLWGDKGWRTKHCPRFWGVYFGMVRWLWRNCAAGFCWSVLAHPVAADETFTVESSGCGLDLDKSHSRAGWFKITSSRGAFHYRWIKTVGRVQISFESGNLLDVYVKDETNKTREPLAIFCFTPALRLK